MEKSNFSLCDKVNKWLGTSYENDSEIPWWFLSAKGNLPEEFILRFYKKLYSEVIFRSQYISYKLLDKLTPRYKGPDWYSISFNQNLPIDFIKENKSRLNKEGIFTRQRITPLNLEEYINIFGISSKEVYKFLNRNPFYTGYTEDFIKDGLHGFYSVIDKSEFFFTSEATITFYSLKNFPELLQYVNYKNSKYIIEFWKVFVRFSFLRTNNKLDISSNPTHIKWIEEINPWKRML